MSTTLKDPSPCPNCGKSLPAGALAGLCPACLLDQGAETDAGEGGRTAHFEPPPLADVAKLFPQLEILDLLGAGGMGAVYKARQPSLDRMVALKILPATNTTGVNFNERFNREARALARLSHPNIVAVHEFGQAGALSFFIMEFVDGANLRQLEQGGRLAPREALQIIPQICDALQYAHDEGVVHRDIKPENVLVDRKGRVKIADFGLAKILGADVESLRLTAEGQVMGTPHYMAPEQVEHPLAVDHRADIYALGVVFYEMLTGDLPLGKFSAPSHKVQVDVRFDEVVLRALENDPARRYQRASEVKTQVENIAGTPAPVAPAPGPATAQRFVRCAGFPLAVRHDGARKIHWKGAAHAFAVVFGVLTLGFGLVSLFTGNSLMGWIGVVGLPSVVARLALAAVTVGWGIRIALSAKEEPEPPPRTPQGTVILPTERFSRKAIVGAVWAPVFFLAAVGYWLLSATTVAGGVVDQSAPALPVWRIVVTMIVLLSGLTAPFGVSLLGWMAVGDIRRACGRISGLPLAVFDGLLFPLLTLDGLLIWAWPAIVNGLQGQPVFEPFHAGEIAVLTKLGSAAICVMVDLWIIRRVWRAVQSGGDAPPAADWWWSRKPGTVVIGLACVLVILGTARRREQTGRFSPAPVAKRVSAGDPLAQMDGTGPIEPTLSAELWAPTVAPGEKPDLDQIWTEANEMMKRGDYEPALQRQLWLHNHSTEINPAVSGVRLSFYLADWVELGRRYPKARQALIEVRDLKTREFDEGRGYSQLFQDIRSINNYLNADAATTALFKRIHQLDPTLAEQCVGYARVALLKSKEYSLCLSYIPDVQADFERQKKNRDRELASTTRNPSIHTPQFQRSADSRFVAGVSQLIEMLNGVGRIAEAVQISDQAHDIVADASLWVAKSDERTEGTGDKRKITIVSKVEPWPAPKAANASLETWAPTANPGESLDVPTLSETAKAMIAARDYESSLQRFIWIHNHAKQHGGDPLGALSDWIELGRRYPKARQALIEIRNLKAYEFEKGQGYFELFGQVWIINRHLGEENATTQLFIRVHELDPALARQCVGFARDTLVKSKEYELCLSYIPDVQADFENARRSREMDHDLAKRNSSMDNPEFRRSADNRFVASVSQLIEMLNAVGRSAEAENIRAQAAAVVDDRQFQAQPVGAVRQPIQPHLESPVPGAQSAYFGTGKLLEEPPQLRFLAWQDDWKKSDVRAVRHPDASAVSDADEIKLLPAVPPSGLNVLATAPADQPGVLHLWFSHPFFRRESLVSVTVLDGKGDEMPLGAHGSMASGSRSPDPGNGNLGWLTYTFSLGDPKRLPTALTLRLRYAIGTLEKQQEVAPDYHGMMGLEGSSQLNGIGQNADGASFVAIAVDAQKIGDRQFGVAAIGRDGWTLDPSGGGTGGHVGTGVRVQQFDFAAPLAEIARFRIGTRPIRTVEWRNVLLPKPAVPPK